MGHVVNGAQPAGLGQLRDEPGLRFLDFVHGPARAHGHAVRLVPPASPTYVLCCFLDY